MLGPTLRGYFRRADRGTAGAAHITPPRYHYFIILSSAKIAANALRTAAHVLITMPLEFFGLLPEYKPEQALHVIRGTVCANAEFFCRKIEPIHPISRVSEILRTVCIPAAECRE